MQPSSSNRLWAILIVSYLLVSVLPITLQAVTKTFTGTGYFSDETKWTGGTLPAIGENLVIDGACIVDNNTGTDNIEYGSLTIGTATGRTLSWATSGTNRLNVYDINAGAGASTLNMTNGGIIIARGTWTSTNLTFTPGAGTIELQSTTALPAAYSIYNNITINGSGIIVSLGAVTVVTGNLTITTGTFSANNFNLSVAGNWANNVSTTAFTAGTATVTFNSSIAQTIGGTFATTFNNLTIANTADTVTLNINAGISGNLSVTSGIFNLAGSTANRANVGGTLTVSGNATLKIDSTNTYPNNYTNNILAITSTVEYSGTTQTVKELTYGNLTISGSGTKTMPGTALEIYGDFSIAGTAMAKADADITVDGSLSISNGSKLSISPAVNMRVSGTITNNAGTSGFVLQSTATGTASLIHNTNNVPATVQRYINGIAEAWHFLSAPVTAQAISNSWLPSGTYGNGSGYDLYLWYEPSNCWIYKLNTTSAINWNTAHPGSNFVVGRGYLYSVQATNPTKEFAGNLNNGPLDYELTLGSADASLKGFNLVGNPYPSSIDWQAASGWTRSNLISSGGGYDMWIWNPTANNYGVFNSFTGSGTNNVTRFIAPMQGYFVQASNAGNLSLDNTTRVFDSSTDWKKAEINPDMLSMVVQSATDNSFDEVRLLFGYTANQAGTAKLFSNVVTAPSLYLPSKGLFYTVAYLTDTIDHPSVPVMFKPGRNGYYTLTCSFNYEKFRTVIIEDRQTNHFQNLKQAQSYSFTASKTDDANRFILHFSPLENITVNEFPAKFFYDDINLIVDLTLISKETDLFVYDLLGRIVLQKKLQGGIKHTLNYNAGSQLLVVCLKNPDGNLCRKLLPRP